MVQPTLELEGGLRWYALRTKPRKEPEVEKRLSNFRLEVFLPWLQSRPPATCFAVSMCSCQGKQPGTRPG
ncbi:MAG: hypothetical protein HYY46_07005 [Deltaproteobacteria bacterium]|nr:hypothetical protein [Deltaproteobacteria bacterium]